MFGGTLEERGENDHPVLDKSKGFRKVLIIDGGGGRGGARLGV